MLQKLKGILVVEDKSVINSSVVENSVIGSLNVCCVVIETSPVGCSVIGLEVTSSDVSCPVIGSLVVCCEVVGCSVIGLEVTSSEVRCSVIDSLVVCCAVVGCSVIGLGVTSSDVSCPVIGSLVVCCSMISIEVVFSLFGCLVVENSVVFEVRTLNDGVVLFADRFADFVKVCTIILEVVGNTSILNVVCCIFTVEVISMFLAVVRNFSFL